MYAAEQAIPSFIAGWLTHHTIPFDPAVLATTCPSEKTLNDIVIDGTRDSILLLEEELADAVAIFIACDKGNRKGIAHFPKVLSWWSKKYSCVRSVCIDADGSGSTSDKCAKAIELSLKKFQNQTVVLRGQTTDSGGEAEDPTKKQRERTRGEERIKIQLTSTEKRYAAIQRIPGILGKQKRMKNALVTKNDLKAQISRANGEAEEFRRRYMISRAQNKRQKERGVDRTYLVVGRIPYKSLRAGVPEHMNFLHTELVHRRTDAADIPAGFRERIKMLKKMEKDNKSFRAQTQVNFEL